MNNHISNIMIYDVKVIHLDNTYLPYFRRLGKKTIQCDDYYYY